MFCDRQQVFPFNYLLLVIFMLTVDNAYSDRAKRPMKIHQYSDMGLEIWTEYSPRWITEKHMRGKKPVFVAQTSPNVYPPAAMTIVSFPGMSVTQEEFEDVAITAIKSGAHNYKVSKAAINKLNPTTALYGDLVGFEAKFRGIALGDEVDVQIFVGQKAGKYPVLVQIYTLKDKLPHIQEQIRRSWNNISYLH
ncbi:MAG: hypothetical protein JAY90_12040 [Candidatus Thiodiazotropha lotti]|nr:hypothetical protein [Candidatus Thiodiazotropha lotti]